MRVTGLLYLDRSGKVSLTWCFGLRFEQQEASQVELGIPSSVPCLFQLEAALTLGGILFSPL